MKKQPKIATDQANASPISGMPPPEERQFGKPNGNPRNPGGWRKEDTARFKLEAMMKLSEKDLKDLMADEDAPLFERRIARALLTENKFETTAQMINQVYGMPKQQVEQHNIELKPILPKPKKGRK